MRIFLHRTLPRMTADHPETLAVAANRLNVDPSKCMAGYYELTTVQYNNALRMGSTIDDTSFENIVKSLNVEVEI